MPIQICSNLGPAECAHAMNKPTNQQKNNKSANHNSTVPQTIVRKTLARRNARKRSNHFILFSALNFEDSTPTRRPPWPSVEPPLKVGRRGREAL